MKGSKTNDIQHNKFGKNPTNFRNQKVSAADSSLECGFYVKTHPVCTR